MPADGCCCVACLEDQPHAPVHQVDERRIARALDRAGYPRVTTLRVQTLGPAPSEVAHDGSMTCPCSMCGVQRSLLRAQGEGNASPFRDLRRAA